MITRLFVYGTLRPDQPGHRFLKELVEVKSVRKARLPKHALCDWDGLPIAVRNDDESVSGFLIEIETKDADDLLVSLDAYEVGPAGGQYSRRLQREEFLINVDTAQETAWAYVLDRGVSSHVERRLLESEIRNGNWTMAEDWVFTRVLPAAYIEAQKLILETSENDKHHVHILGTYLVLYSCLERLGLHLYGPRRYEVQDERDRNALQAFLQKNYFGVSQGPPWFEVKRTMQVFDSDTMTRRDLKNSPPHFWATMRNNSAHQGKAPVSDYTILLQVAVSTLGDFLALALLNLDDVSDGYRGHTPGLTGVSDILREKWRASGFNPIENGLQNL